MIFGLIVICAVLLCAWLSEKREGKAVMRSAKRYREERDEAVRRADDLEDRRIAIESSLAQAEKTSAFLFDTYMRSADHTSELIAHLDNPIDYAFDGWEIEVRDHRSMYYKKDGITLIREDGKFVGFYRPDGEYEAPTAEVVDSYDDYTEAQ